MKLTKVVAITGGIALGALAGATFQFNSVSAAVPVASHSSVAVSSPAARPTASPSPSPSCPPMTLAIAFTSNVTDTSALHLHLPWGRAADREGSVGRVDGASTAVSIGEQLPVHDVTTGTLREVFGHNAIAIVLDS